MKSMKAKGLMIALLVPLMFSRCGDESFTPQRTATPEFDFTVVEKDSVVQRSVSFKIKKTSMYADSVKWKVYSTDTDLNEMPTVMLKNVDTELTLSHKTDVDIQARDYYITATEHGKTESLRLQVTVNEQTKTAKPEVAVATVRKASAVIPQTSVIFTLTNNPMYENATWMVYTAEQGPTLVDGVIAENRGDKLQLSHETNIIVMPYWVAATELGKAESKRLKVTVDPYVESDTTATPEALITSIAKTSASPQQTVSFTLTGTYTNTTWTVYAGTTGTTVNIGMTAMNSGTTLVLRHPTDIPLGDHYVAAKETNKFESKRLKLTVTRFTLPQTATPTVASTSIAKSSATQRNVDFTLTNDPMYVSNTEWKAYATSSGEGTVGNVSVRNSGSQLTLSDNTNIRTGDYYVAAKEPDKLESARTKLTITTNILTQTPTPVVTNANATVTKTATPQASVVFTLKNGFSNAKWDVYTSSTGEGASDVTAASTGTTLTLTHATDVPGGEYWVTVTENNKSESVAIKLTVIPYVAPGQTPTPTADIIAIAKTTPTQREVQFTLTNIYPYVNTTWKVYDTAGGTAEVSGVTASNSGPTLTLRHTTNLPEREYFVAATTANMTESNRLKLRVDPPLGAKDVVVTAPLDLTLLVDAPVSGATPRTVFPEQLQYTGTIEWKDSLDTPISGTFELLKTYKAVLTLTAKPGYTFVGMPQNHFTHDYANGMLINATNSGIVTINFAKLGGQTVDDLDLSSRVTAPVLGETPDSRFTAPQYTGSIEWTDANDVPLLNNKFEGNTVYKAVVTLTTLSDYSFSGVAMNSFTHTEALYGTFPPNPSPAYQITNAANSGKVTIIFPATDPSGPTSDVRFIIKDVEPQDVNATIEGGDDIRSVAVNVQRNTTAVIIRTRKTDTQTIAIGGLGSTNVSSTNNDKLEKEPTFTVNTTTVQTGGAVRFSLTVSEDGLANIVYNVVVTVASLPPDLAADVPFMLSMPAQDTSLGNTITTTAGATPQRTVTVNVANNTDTVKVACAIAANQNISKNGGDDNMYVQMQGTATAPVIRLTITPRIKKEGGTMKYNIAFSDTLDSTITPPLIAFAYYAVEVTVAPPPPTKDVTFSLNSPTGAGNEMTNNGGTIRGVGVNVAYKTDSVKLNVSDKTATQTISIGGTHAGNVVVDTTTTTAPVIKLITTSVKEGGTMQYTLTLSETDKSSITYTITVNVAGMPHTADMPFILKEPAPGDGNSLTGGGASRGVNVIVNRKTTKVLIERALLGTQVATIDPANYANVKVGGTNLAPVDTVNTSSIQNGGEIKYTWTVSEDDLASITYNVTITVKSLTANMRFSQVGTGTTVDVEQNENTRLVVGTTPSNFTATTISGEKTATQTVAVSGPNASDVAIAYTPADDPKATTVKFTTNTTSGSKFFFITVSEPSKADIVYPVMINKATSTAPVTFPSATLVPNGTATITGGDAAKIVTVNVPKATTSVVLTGTKTANQTVTVSTLDGSSTALVTSGGTNTAPTFTVNTSAISADGGTLQFVIKVTDTGTPVKEAIYYIVNVNVAAP